METPEKSDPRRGLSREQLQLLVIRRDKKYVGDLSDPVQRCLYENNCTNAFLDTVEEQMVRDNLLDRGN